MARHYTDVEMAEPSETDDDFLTDRLFPYREWRWFDGSEPA